MTNRIKQPAAGLALQVTKPARSAELVEENADGEVIRHADVYVYGFENLLMVVDAERIDAADRAELVASAARDTDTVYERHQATLSDAGNGYQVQLPGAAAAGFELDDRAPVVPRQGMLFIHDGKRRRLVEDLAAIRDEQTGV